MTSGTEHSSSLADELAEMMDYIGFDEGDERRVAELADTVEPLIPALVDRFYAEVLRHPAASAVFRGGGEQIDRLRDVLAKWLSTLFSSRHDVAYYERVRQIGTAHVRVGLPQRYMFLGMELVWQELERGLRAVNNPTLDDPRPATAGLQSATAGLQSATAGLQPVSAKDLGSLHKLLMLDLTIMLESYKENYSREIREYERASLAEKLTRTQHLAEIGQLAASLAHEIKNPLAGISGAIQVIAESMSDADPHREIVREILGQIARLDATVKDLLLFARPSPPNRRAIRLDRLVSRVLALMKQEPDLRRIKAIYAGGTDGEDGDGEGGEATCGAASGIAVEVDEGQIEQLLINLILNAAQASHDGGTVTVAAELSAKHAVLTVTDEGDGIPKSVLDRALEPFFTTKARGTGLGLPICRRIAESHGGTLNLHSEAGRGTRVTVVLPLSGGRDMRD